MKHCDEEDGFTDDEDVDSNDDDSLMDHTVYLSDFIPDIPVKHNKSPSNAKNVRKSTSDNNKEPVVPHNKVIIVNDEESAKKHKRMYNFTRKRDIILKRYLLDVHECTWCWDGCWDNKNKRKRRQKYRQNKLSLLSEEIDDSVEPQEQQDTKEPLTYDSCEITLVDNDAQVSELTRVWRERYNEGGSSPRKFTINISDSITSSSKNSLESIHILVELKDNKDRSPNHNHASIKLFIDTERESEFNIPTETSQLIIKDFCHAISTSSEVMSVKDVVDKARICIQKHLNYLSMKKTISSSKNSTSLDQYEEHFGWKGEVYMEKEAIAEIKKKLDNKVEKYCDPLPSSNPAGECGICFDGLTGNMQL